MRAMQLTSDALTAPSAVGDPDYDLAWLVSVCLSTVQHIERRAEPDCWSDEQVNRWCDLYNEGRRRALALPATTDTGRAALAILALSDMRRESVRAENDPSGMAFLGLAEDLIARII